MSGAQIDNATTGTVNIFALNGESMAIARAEVEAVSAEVEEASLQWVVTGTKEIRRIRGSASRARTGWSYQRTWPTFRREKGGKMSGEGR